MPQDPPTSPAMPSEQEGQLLPSTGELLLATLHPRDCLSPPRCAYLADACHQEPVGSASIASNAPTTLLSTGRALKLVRARVECAPLFFLYPTSVMVLHICLAPCYTDGGHWGVVGTCVDEPIRINYSQLASQLCTCRPVGVMSAAALCHPVPCSACHPT